MEGRRVEPATAAATTPRTTETMPRTPSPQYRRAHSCPHHGVGRREESSCSVVFPLSVLSAGLVVLTLVMIMIITRIHKLNTSVKKLSMQQRAATPAITKDDLDAKGEMIAYKIEDQLERNFDLAMMALRDEQRTIRRKQRALQQIQGVLLQRTNTTEDTEDTKPTKLAQPASASSASQDAASCGFHGEHEMGEGSDEIMPFGSGIDIFKYRRTFPRPSALATG